MQSEVLKVAQYVLKHPIICESEDYKKRYINTLEYFVNKYATEDVYAHCVLKLYKNKLLEYPESYEYKDDELKRIAKGVLSWKMKKFND